MTSFRSKYYPNTTNKFRIFQEYALYHIGWLMAIWMIAILIRMANHLPIFYWGITGVISSLILGNLFAFISIQRNFAEIFFVSGHFCLITVDELLFGRKNEVFPISYASPSRDTERIIVHYHDRIVELRREDWQDFELIWNWLTNPPPDVTYHYNPTH